MSEKPHYTAGPLHIGKYPTSVIAADGFPLADVDEFPVLETWEELGIRHWSDAPGKASIERPAAEAAASARRIVATWNACDGIPTEALECQAKKQITEKLIKLNQELVDACQMAFDAQTMNADKFEHKYYPTAGPLNVIEKLQTALCRAKEGL